MASVLSEAQRMPIDECTAGTAFILSIVVALGRSRVPCPTIPTTQTVLNGVRVNPKLSADSFILFNME